MKKNLTTLFKVAAIMLLQTFSAFSQSHLQDVVYMKDGSTYRGIIRQQNSNDLKIEIAGGSLIVLSKQNIDSIKNENLPVSDGFTFRQKEFGYFNITEIGIPVGTAQVYDNWYSTSEKLVGGFAAQSIQGYRFYSHYMVGAGAAIDLIQHPMLQPFIDLRYELSKGRATPFAYADWGYNFDLSKTQSDTWQKTDYTGGTMWAAGAGMRFNFKSSGAFLFDVGYKYAVREEQMTYPGADYSILNHYDLRRLIIRMGLAF